MDINILGQGFTGNSTNSVGNKLIEFLADKQFHTFTGMSAFTSQSGINGLSKHISAAKKHLKPITIITGIDMLGTSKEALEALLNLKINAYIFYQPSQTIFHPKIYLFEGKEKSQLIIGSSNLTPAGLFSNVETSLLITTDNKNSADLKIIEDLKDYFKGIFDLTDPNLKKLTKKIISDLVQAKIVPTEVERKILYEKQDNAERKATQNIISKIFPKRVLSKIPKEFRAKKTKKVTFTKSILLGNTPIVIGSTPTAKATTKATALGKLVWTRKKLPASSVQRSPGGNPTGGLRLVQDRFVDKGYVIDQTSYFRNKLFGKYSWKQIKAAPLVEAATVPFEITVKGNFIGKFDLEVRHKPSGEAGQHNYTTSISWGEVGEIIKNEKLNSKRLDLYAPKANNKVFHIVIA